MEYSLKEKIKWSTQFLLMFKRPDLLRMSMLRISNLRENGRCQGIEI